MVDWSDKASPKTNCDMVVWFDVRYWLIRVSLGSCALDWPKPAIPPLPPKALVSVPVLAMITAIWPNEVGLALPYPVISAEKGIGGNVCGEVETAFSE